MKTMCGTKKHKCEWCGKPIPSKNSKGKARKYCSVNCRVAANQQKNKEKSLKHWEDDAINNYKFKTEDYYNHFKDPEFHQNDNNWGLGESFLKEHAFKSKTQEEYYIKKEMERIFNRKKKK